MAVKEACSFFRFVFIFSVRLFCAGEESHGRGGLLRATIVDNWCPRAEG